MTSGLAGRGPGAGSGSACRTWRWNPAPASRPRATVFSHLGAGKSGWTRRCAQLAPQGVVIVPEANAFNHKDR